MSDTDRLTVIMNYSPIIFFYSYVLLMCSPTLSLKETIDIVKMRKVYTCLFFHYLNNQEETTKMCSNGEQLHLSLKFFQK